MVSPQIRSIQYPARVIRRASRAVRCSPFTITLFEAMQYHSVALRDMTGRAAIQQGYARYPLTELMAENYSLWLIQTGVLRREVDGQGLTDSFRLTPLGRQLVYLWHNQPSHTQTATIIDYVLNWIARRVRRPSWL